MARATIKMSGGQAKHHLIDHPYFLKEVPMNPYLGAVHNGKSTGFQEGFTAKYIPFLYRFRHNLNPGMQAGFFARNIAGKHVHWLEVSTIEKLRVRMTGDEAFPPMVVSVVVIAFTLYHCFRLAAYHPDITLFNLGVFTSKPWIRQMRFSEKHPMDKPIFRYITRSNEFYNFEDPYKTMVRNGYAANDPYVDAVKSLGLTDALTAPPGKGCVGKDVVAAVAETLPRNPAPVRWTPY